jgi:hypothetical protein
MNSYEVEQSLLDLLKGPYSSLAVSYNEHSANYQTAAEADSYDEFRNVEWVSPQEKEVAIRNNTVWILQWYPLTPVGFCEVGASTLQACLDYATVQK